MGLKMYLKILFAVTAWGGSFIATKVALREISPVTVVWLRFAIGVVILGASVIRRKQWAIPRRSELGYFAFLGFLGITFHQWLQSTGLVTSQATTTAWIIATTPVFIAALGALVLKERLGWAQIFGIALAALGVLLILTKGNLGQLAHGQLVQTQGDWLILISAPNWAVFSILSRKGLSHHPAARMMFFVMGFGWLFTTILLFLGPGLAEIGRLSLNGWTGVLFLGIGCTGLAYIFWYDGLQAIPASRLGAFLYFEPLVTVVVAAIILSEPLLLASMIGGAVILAGVWMVNKK